MLSELGLTQIFAVAIRATSFFSKPISQTFEGHLPQHILRNFQIYRIVSTAMAKLSLPSDSCCINDFAEAASECY